MPPREGIYGYLAEFNTPTDLVRSNRQARTRQAIAGWSATRRILSKRLRPHSTSTKPASRSSACSAGLMGVTTAFLMQTWINVWGYPLNIAGRPVVVVARIHHSSVRVDHSVRRPYPPRSA